MNTSPESPAQGLLSRGMAALLGAQFLSAMADNLLFVAAVALLKQASDGDELLPLLQISFVLAFILLAPYVGPFADAFSKGRVMFNANLVKLVGAALILMGVNPLIGYAVAGVGAAIYSPAKYGILTQLVTPNHLVKANSLLEGSTIAAILLGVLAGGWLADRSVLLAVEVAAGFYLLAAAANLGIPTLPVIHALTSFRALGRLPRVFLSNMAVLWRNHDARFSIAGTSLFWGMGASLRLLMFAWVPAALNILDNQAPANLMGIVSVGIVLGAGLAAFLVRVDQVNRALVGGVLLGPLIVALAPMNSYEMAVIVLIGLGVAGGYFVVPLNALLQERGHETIGAGRTLAVQNLFENLAMLGMAGLYFLAVAIGMKPVAVAYGFGGVVTLGMLVLAGYRLRHSARRARSAAGAVESLPD
ncbi:lysophospholipid transporter LplT [Halothiobacillus diazotrophicus]|uniref:Lysophospholipid transporter LplT n=1 Tax=Halothiobacillus diazotrophicus TaxID=1860122 RepID=A0A191ZJS0_9GAMM|nr:lysophospholipid transporter LplT [Halothiobacillus diazotrophicus]ANJ68134.1 lysophospholipid transporter LplT [Halothiobacillus diazotrophicus]